MPVLHVYKSWNVELCVHDCSSLCSWECLHISFAHINAPTASGSAFYSDGALRADSLHFAAWFIWFCWSRTHSQHTFRARVCAWMCMPVCKYVQRINWALRLACFLLLLIIIYIPVPFRLSILILHPFLLSLLCIWKLILRRRAGEIERPVAKKAPEAFWTPWDAEVLWH